ncbi:DoxX family protein [Paenibacillus sp. MWE-103]|uniref:DoxX family protein n=1 Tax=Paenibacillus artemisiicola TaxID=1172618 RepID=A0ABS3WHR3_9BACL|nr:DoxX family protein [Paenibacillus artemisiicola]MBO7747670.1 DoxX family protein [Paenibacillus artemisiicola]
MNGHENIRDARIPSEEIAIGIALGLLIIRLAVGLTLAGHGTQKLFGWFGGYGLKSTGGWMSSIGLKPGLAIALLAGLAELFGGLLFALGLWVVVAAVLIVLTMLGAIASIHFRHGYWVRQNGMEYNVILIAVAIGVALVGPGEYAIP